MVDVVTSGTENFLFSSESFGLPASLTTGEDVNSKAEEGRVTTSAGDNPDLSALKTTGFVLTGGGTLVFFV